MAKKEFDSAGNKRTSREGAPTQIKGGFPGITPPGSYNLLTSLDRVPEIIGPNIDLGIKQKPVKP